MKKTFLRYLATIVIFSLIVISCASCSPKVPYSEGDGELNILCTVFAPFDFARSVGGGRVKVSLLQDSGADMHNYTPTSATLEAISQADLFIYVGGVSDVAWVDNAISAAGNDSLTVLRLMDLITPVYAELENDWSSHDHAGSSHIHDGHAHSDHDHENDEHIWTSLLNAKLTVGAIKDVLCRLDPSGVDVYEANFEGYVKQLDELELEYRAFFGEHHSQTMIFADRFPFVYLMHDYHVPYKAAFSGCSTEVNASFGMQTGMIDTVKASRSPYVVTIEGNDKSLAEAVAAETGCAIVTLNSLQSVKRSDIKNGITYLEVMYENLAVLKEATP